MKHLLLLIVILLSGCKKSTVAPQARPSSPTTVTSTPTLNSYEQDLIGNWVMDKKESWYAGDILITELTVDSLTCRIKFDTTQTSGWKNCIMGQHCQNSPGYWKADDLVYINFFNVLYTVEYKSTTSMILSSGPYSSGYGFKFYFHKS